MVNVDSYSVTNDLSPEFKEYEELVQLQRAVDQKNNQERFDFAEKDAKERQPLHKALEAEIKQFDAQAPTGSVFYPATLNYERGLFIGNLLFKLKSPSAVIQPRTAEHVKQAITLTKKLVEVAAKTSENTSSAIKPRLTVKGGGHSYAGHCVNQNGIVLDMQQMNKIEIVSDGKELRIGAGCLWKDVYNYLETHAPNKIVVGGLCPFVGVAGFTLGGGIGPFSRSYGLGIDNVTEITVVTAKGDELVLNKENPKNAEEAELFWALCGGGGGNFGVVTEFKTVLHDLEGEVCFGQLTWNLDDPEEKKKFMDMMEKFNTSYSDDDEVWTRKLTTDAIWRFNKQGELLGQMTVVYKGNMEECRKALSPLHEFIINDKKHNTINQMPWRKLVVIEEGFDIKTRIYHWHTSFVLSKGQITRDLVEKIIALLKLTHKITGDTKSHVLWSQMGGKVSDYASDATSFPWRTGVYPINFKLQWTKPEKREEIEHLIHTAKYILQPHAIDKSASYLNYIDGTLDNWQQAYYGENYDRLKRAKLEWDSDNFFEFGQSIERKGHERVQIAAQSLPKKDLEAIEAVIEKNPTNGLESLYESVRKMAGQVDLEGKGFAQKDDEGETTETESQEPGFFERSMEQWREFSLPDPSVLEEIESLKADEIFKIFARQRLEADNI